MTFYNDNEPFVCGWLENLIKVGEISDGTVSRAGIESLSKNDLSGFDRVHLFAGIGGWDYALRLAGWPIDRPVWTGSCPCQPFSVAGRGKGTADKRHLWPEMRRLIDECRPPTIFGEQVASAAGRRWLSGVFTDLEGMGYAVAGADLCAAGRLAPHIRQRLWWVADAQCNSGRQGWLADQPRESTSTAGTGTSIELGRCSDVGRLGNPNDPRPQGRSLNAGEHADQQLTWRPSKLGWANHEWLPCLDGKKRRTQPGLFPLAHGVSGRVGKLRAYGNSIVPQVAATFIRAFLEAGSGLNCS